MAKEGKHGSVGRFRWKAALLAVLLVAAAVLGALVYRGLTLEKKPEITATGITAKISEASDLTTAQLEYRGLVTYSDGDIPFLTQKGFTMIYTADIRAGIDLARVGVEVTPEKVIVELPRAQIQSISVDADSIEFFDERFSLFNWPDKSDAVEAVKAAQADAEEQVDRQELIDTAQRRTEELLVQLLEDSIGGRTLELRSK